MTRLKLATTGGTTVKPAVWRRHPQRWLGGALIAASIALAVAFWVDPTLGGYANRIVGAIFAGCMLFLIVDHRRRQPPEREPDQLIVHVHRRSWFVLALGLALAGAPSPAKADLGMGEMTQAVSDGVEAWFEQLLDSVCAWLLMPQSGLPVATVPNPLPKAITGAHVTATPLSVDAAAAYMAQKLQDREQRVDRLDEISELAATSSTTNAATLAAIAAASAMPPVSVAAGLQLNTQATVAGAGAAASNTAMLAGMAALAADQALREERVMTEAWEATKAANPDGLWTGQRTWQSETIKLNF